MAVQKATSRLLKVRRIDEIKTLLEQETTVSIDRLCEVFNVSKNTIRRDINVLEQEGFIKKVYGGITLKQQTTDTPEPFHLRETHHAAQKQKIARIAASYVRDGDVIFIDSGTTTVQIMPYLMSKNRLTIVTTSLTVINAAAALGATNHMTVMATGGTFYAPSMSFIGPSVLRCLENYNISKMFFAATGITLSNGATNASPFENEVKRALMEKTGEKYLLVDYSKLGVSALMSYSPLETFDCVIMDKEPPQEYVDYFAAHNVTLRVD